MTFPEKPRILLDVKDSGYAVLTINRPEKRNAVDRIAQMQIQERLEEARAKGAKAIVITGAGEVSFCAGADLRDTSPEIPATAKAPTSWMGTQQAITEHPAVIIAAVNGYALGGGLTLVNNADLAIASATATFGIPEITLGVYASLAGPSTVQRIAPKHVSMMIFTGERIDAAKALEIGLVNEVVAPEQVLARAEELAAKVAQYDALALDVAKKSIRAEQHMEWDDALLHGSWSTSFLAATRAATDPRLADRR
ncbi:enoyl-CoA hydratase/isomerase family protein [Nocardia fluminea]|uniref:enoyl-CoA hydratase/isomerase family protein n=1 Tax=Nocardia fluminea TaxID=134984 RepID=UPI0034188CCC